MSFSFKRSITAMEVLVVVAAVLFTQAIVASGYFAIKSYLAHERDITRINDVEKISAAIRTYYQQYGRMPVNHASGRGYCQNEQNFLSELVETRIISSIPVDPQFPTHYYCYYDYGAASKYGGYVNSTMETIKEPAGHCAWDEGNNWCMHNSNSYCKCNPYENPTLAPIKYPVDYPTNQYSQPIQFEE